jgi:microsomal epoxide hydrolase
MTTTLRRTLLALAAVAATVLPVAPALAADGVAQDGVAQDGTAQDGAPAEDWRSGYVTTPDGVRIHYVEATPQGVAAEPSLLFVPGWTLTAEIWQPQIDHFRSLRRVVAMDPRSQGLSDHPDDGHYPQARGRDVAAVIHQLALAPVVPVCWSLAVAECVAVVEELGTEGLAGLVLVDGLAGGDYDPQWAPVMLAWLGTLQRDRESGTAAFVRSMYRKPQSEEYLRRVTEQSLRTPTDAMMALFLGGLTNDNRAALEAIDKPVLFTVTRSPFLPRYEEMRQRLPQVRFEVFDAGHALFVDEAERFNTLLAEFLDGLDDGSWRGAAAQGATVMKDGAESTEEMEEENER